MGYMPTDGLNTRSIANSSRLRRVMLYTHKFEPRGILAKSANCSTIGANLQNGYGKPLILELKICKRSSRNFCMSIFLFAIFGRIEYDISKMPLVAMSYEKLLAATLMPALDAMCGGRK